MKKYTNPHIEIIRTADLLTGSPETGFIPFNTLEPLKVNILDPANEDLYEDIT